MTIGCTICEEIGHEAESCPWVPILRWGDPREVDRLFDKLVAAVDRVLNPPQPLPKQRQADRRFDLEMQKLMLAQQQAMQNRQGLGNIGHIFGGLGL